MIENTAERLHPLEVQILIPFRETERMTNRELAERSGLQASQMRTAIEWILLKNLIDAREIGREEFVSLTKTGEQIAAQGFPESRILSLLSPEKGLPVGEIAGLISMDAGEVNPLIGSLKKLGAVEISRGQVFLRDASASGLFAARRKVFEKVGALGRAGLNGFSPEERKEILSGFKKRTPEKGFFRIDEKIDMEYGITEAGKALLPHLKLKNTINQLTGQMLASGSWRSGELRQYDIHLNPPRLILGKKHPYRQFLDNVRSKLTSLGFEEMAGPLVETEFWDMDALFMPQSHSARNIHDVYFVRRPSHAREIAEPFLSQVVAAHENGGDTGSRGWGYDFDRERTKRLVMRSQGTALSARTLAAGPRIPGKYFAVARCFRYDQIDATHGTDFFQVEGIVADRNINFRKLLGLLKLFAREIAQASEIRFTPAYFPFTEPSVEMHARHPKLGWIELGGAGIFRPEVTRSLNTDVPVIAWGLGVDRMAMVALGINDIRQLFSHDLDFLRQSKVV